MTPNVIIKGSRLRRLSWNWTKNPIVIVTIEAPKMNIYQKNLSILGVTKRAPQLVWNCTLIQLNQKSVNIKRWKLNKKPLNIRGLRSRQPLILGVTKSEPRLKLGQNPSLLRVTFEVPRLNSTKNQTLLVFTIEAPKMKINPKITHIIGQEKGPLVGMKWYLT